MYFNGLFNLDDWNTKAKYIVLDDFNIEFLPQYKSWFGAQECFVITDKYRKKRTVEWGKPLIWVNNDDPRNNSKVDRNWMELNSVFCFINYKLY